MNNSKKSVGSKEVQELLCEVLALNHDVEELSKSVPKIKNLVDLWKVEERLRKCEVKHAELTIRFEQMRAELDEQAVAFVCLALL